MSDEQHQNNELTLDARLAPSFENAVTTWHVARHRFQNEPMRQHQNAYDKATDELGQAFSEWKAEQPELFEQFKMFFQSHPES